MLGGKEQRKSLKKYTKKRTCTGRIKREHGTGGGAGRSYVTNIRDTKGATILRQAVEEESGEELRHKNLHEILIILNITRRLPLFIIFYTQFSIFSLLIASRCS